VVANGGKLKTDRYLSVGEIGRLDQGLRDRERLVFRGLVLLGLRPGELFARRWEDWTGDRLIINSAVFRGAVGDTKTKGSKGFVWLPKTLQQDLAFYRLGSRFPDATDFIFSARPGIPGQIDKLGVFHR
jgi:integrase